MTTERVENMAGRQGHALIKLPSGRKTVKANADYMQR